MSAESFASGSQCPRCGMTLAGGDAGGHCPRCLVMALFSSEENGPGMRSIGSPGGGRRLGDFELLHEIARGGMGVVYRARQVSLDRVVALKVMRDSAVAGQDAVERFKAEAAAAAKLRHPNIVAIYEVGESEGQYYFAMDLVDGVNLAQRTRVEPLSPKSAAELLATVADAVQHAHERGVLHRDLKPSNVLLDPQGRPFVTDFGLARTLEGDSTLTLTGQVLGTPGYMPPEQAVGKGTVGPAADIYALGALLYHLLAGRPPFLGSTTVETLRRVVEDEPLSVRLLNPEASRDLAAVCEKCLAKRPAERYAAASEVAADLRRFLRGEPTWARPAGAVTRLARWCQRKPALAGSLALTCLVAAIGFFGVIWQWRAAETARSERQDQLWHSLLQQAQFSVRSGKVGHRTNAMAAIKLASSIRPSLELRDCALAALMLPDLGSRLSWKPGEKGIDPWCFDGTFEHYVLHDDDGVVRVYRTVDHGLVSEVGRGGGGTTHARFSPDGRFLAVAFENVSEPVELRVWDWRQRRLEAQTTNAHAKFGLPTFDFTLDSRELLYAARQGGIGRIDLANGRPLSPLLTNTLASIVQFSPDGKRLVTAIQSRVEIWEIESGHLVNSADFSSFPKTGAVQSLAWLPSNRGLIVGCYGSGLYVVRLDGAPPEHFGDDKGIVPTRLFFNPAGDLLFVAGWFDLFEIWDVATLTPLVREVRSLGSPYALSRDGRRIAVVREKVGLGIWEFFEPVGLRKFASLDLPPSAVALDVDATGRWLATCHAKYWQIWDLSRSRLVARGSESHAAIKFDPDGGAFLTCGPEGLKRWPFLAQTNGPAESSVSVGAAELVDSVNMARAMPDPKPAPTGGMVSSSRARKSEFNGAAFSANGQYVAILDGGFIYRLAVTNRSVARPIRMRRPGDNSYGIDPYGRWLWTALHNQRGLDLYDLEGGRWVKTLAPSSFGAGRFRPTAGELVASTTGGLLFFESGTWNLVTNLPLHDVGIGYGLTGFAPDHRIAWYTSANRMRLLDVSAGQFFATLEHPGSLYSDLIAADPAAPRVYMASGNGLVAWDFAALRTELSRLGLDWPDAHPASGFSGDRIYR